MSEPGAEAPFVPFSAPDLTEREIEAVVRVLRSGWINTGPEARAFEAEFCAAVGARHGVAVNSCTAALHLAAEALGIGPGTEVLVPTMTFTASAEVITWLGARPVLVDVRADDHNIDLERAEAAVTPRTRAVVPVHFAGQACDLDGLQDLGRRKELPLIEDAAHAFPAEYHGRAVGSFGRVTCFSFYSNKNITTAEGGMACTEDDGLAARMRTMRLHGISRDGEKRYTREGTWAYEVVAAGFKYNLTDIAAALGRVQLARALEMRHRRDAVAARFTDAFRSLEAIDLPTEHPDRRHARHLYVIRLRDGVLSIPRDRFVEELKSRGIGTSVHYIPLHLHPHYRDAYGYRPGDFPVAEDLFRRCLSLPLYSRMTDAEADRVVEAVTSVCRTFRR